MTILAGACDAINPSGRNNLRPEHAKERHLYEGGKDEKMASVSNTMHFKELSSSEDYSYKKRPSHNKYKVYKGSYASEDAAFEKGRAEVKNKKKALIVTRKPRPYKKPSSWSGDGYKPSNKPTPSPIEPIESPEPTTSWYGDAYTEVPTPSPIEPIESPEPTISWKDDGFEPVLTDPPTQ